jgi:glycosyltransferase involved in cell wall biosynthesis
MVQAAAPLVGGPETHVAAVRLLVLADGPGATQVISFDLPFRALREAGVMQLLMLQESDFESLTPRTAEAAIRGVFDHFRPTHVVVSRFGGNGSAGIPRAARAHGVGYVMHLDDNLFAVPVELGKAKFDRYNDPKRKNRLRLLCERADHIYVSTKPLKSQIDAMGFSPEVRSGDIYCAVPIAPAPYKPGKSARVFGYMGTSGHAADLEMIAPAIAAVLKALPDACFETFGSIKAPQSLKTAFGDRVRETKAAGSYLEFLEIFQLMEWRVGLAPLMDTPFNACKADTKFVEYTLAGMPVIASNLPLYQAIAADGRGRLASSAEDWKSGIESLLNDESGGRDMVAKAQQHLGAAYSMERLRAQALHMLGISV